MEQPIRLGLTMAGEPRQPREGFNPILPMEHRVPSCRVERAIVPEAVAVGVVEVITAGPEAMPAEEDRVMSMARPTTSIIRTVDLRTPPILAPAWREAGGTEGVMT